MRCRQVKHRLSQYEKSGGDPLKDQPLADHLKSCRHCAEEASAAKLLTRLLRSAGEADEADIRPLDAARRRIEASGAVNVGRESIVRRILDALSGTGRRQSIRLAYPAVVLALLLVVTLVPFRYHRTVGYAVAFAGVEKELVEDNEIVCDLLYDLGLWEADVDVLGCDTTCNVQVVSLKSLEEARMVVSALNQVESCCASSNIIPVREGTSASLLERASRDIL
jgi:hypothetical protein